MRSMYDMDTIQIEITNSCGRRCANCTRLGQHNPNRFFMEYDEFTRAIDSLVGYPKMVGIMGGEPLLHPEFVRFCQYAYSKIPRKQLGLWTCLPVGYESNREAICKAFGNIFLNDHTRGDIFHHPFLVGIQEVVTDRNQMFVDINNCFFQQSWSASVNQNGAFFCEIAAAFSTLDNSKGWPVEPGWWWRTPKDFKEQIEYYCPRCGGAAKLKRRPSVGFVDDISPLNFELLKNTSPKIKEGRCEIHNLKTEETQDELAAYKDQRYRDTIADRYGIYLTLNDLCFNEPHLGERPKPLFDLLKERYG